MATRTNDPSPTRRDAPRLVMQGVHKRFGATVALEAVDLSLYPGQVLALLGENGAGKSTLMKVLAGAVQPDQGRLWINGRRYVPSDPADARRQGVSMVHQELSLAGHLSVAENILLGIEPSVLGVLRPLKMQRMAREALEQLGRPEIDVRARVDQLSLAEQQLVEIARALVLDRRGCSPGVIVLDEPTSSLGQEDKRRLFQVIRRLRERGAAIIYITHFLEELHDVADRYAVLRDGETVGSGDIAAVTVSELIRMMVGGASIKAVYQRNRRPAGPVLLSLEKLAGEQLPRAASIEVSRGEVVGIAGLLGTGRTELLRSIYGLDAIRSGQIRFMAFAGHAAPAVRIAQGMGMLSEDRKSEGLALEMSIADNVTLPRRRGLGPGSLVLPSRTRAAAGHWIKQLGIRCWDPGQRVGELSGGNQQKVALARLLDLNVDLLLLDEPTRGIDVGSKAQIYELIDDLAARGRAVLMVSSYLPELLGICDRIAVMSRGVLGPARPVEQYTQHQLLQEASSCSWVNKEG